MATPTSTTGSSDPVTTSSAWVSLHIHYAADLDPLLTGCVAPLVRRLRDRGAVGDWFFVRYWVEGPHLRLRFRPEPGMSRTAVAETAGAEVTAFLRQQPAPDVPASGTPEQYRALFVAEYGQAAWDRRYGANRTMPVQPNNTHLLAEYEPEYHRYGGPHGMRLSEWHFCRSSDTVLQLLARRPLSPATRLGISAQLTMHLVAAFLDHPSAARSFLLRYAAEWERTYLPGQEGPGRHEAAYRRVASRLRPKVNKILTDATSGAPDGAGWGGHCRALWHRVTDLATGSRSPTADPAAVAQSLLVSYVHMTNNRLGLTIPEETYAADLLAASVSDLLAWPSAGGLARLPGHALCSTGMRSRIGIALALVDSVGVGVVRPRERSGGVSRIPLG